MSYNNAEKYVKKPVVVEAFHYNKLYTDFRDLVKFCPDIIGVTNDGSPIIKTLEGDVVVPNNCYIIKGVKGEFYPCQEDIFNLTYELYRPPVDYWETEVNHMREYERWKSKQWNS